MSQTADLHRALLRPFLLTTLRAAGFHSTRPAVLDTLLNLTERHLTLLASTTASHARSSHNTATPTITDVRLALEECGVLSGSGGGAAEEAWKERMRVALGEVRDVNPLSGEVSTGAQGAGKRREVEKRRREEEDTRDVMEFVRWFEGGGAAGGDGQQGGGGAEWREIKRVAGMNAEAAGPAVGVGGGVVQAEDFLSGLKKRHGKVGGDEDARLMGTVLGKEAEEREVVVEGGPVGSIREWRPREKARVRIEDDEQVGAMEGVEAPG